MRYFELIDDKSSKFWEIYNSWNTEPQYIETRFGKIGSDGRVSKIVYHTLKEGTDMENKLIQQKEKKGYVEKSNQRYLRHVAIASPPSATKKAPATKKMTPPAKKDCPAGKVRNPKTGRCVNDPALKKGKSPKTKGKISKKAKGKSPKAKGKSPCPAGKVRNPKTGRCINDPSLKKKLLKKNLQRLRQLKKPLLQRLNLLAIHHNYL